MKKVYGIYGVGMVLLVAAALLLPQFIFSIQDRYGLSNTEVETRSSLHGEQWNTAYEMQTSARMRTLASMDLSAATITSIGYDVKGDPQLTQQLEQMFQQEWITRMDEMTGYMLHDIWEEMGPEKIRNSKRYIVYEKENREGVVLMLWYLDLYLEEAEARVRLLVDSETSTIYYVKVTGAEGATYGGDTNVAVWHEMLYVWADQVMGHLEFYDSYYEAEMKELEVLEKAVIEKAVWDGEDGWHMTARIDDNQYLITFPLPYGDADLEFQVQIKDNYVAHPHISVGITTIGSMIPEMMQE